MLFNRDVVDLSLRRAMELHHRAVSREQMRRFEGYMAEIFATCGLNLNTPATEETPRRFLQALFEATEGYDGEPKLRKVFETESRGNPDFCASAPALGNAQKCKTRREPSVSALCFRGERTCVALFIHSWRQWRNGAAWGLLRAPV